MSSFHTNFMPAISGWPFNKDDAASKSFTVVYVRNATATPSTSTVTKYTSSIGRRQPDDRLIHFESRNVTNHSRFPSRAFEYTGDDSITCVKFAFNVSRFRC